MNTIETRASGPAACTLSPLIVLSLLGDDATANAATRPMVRVSGVSVLEATVGRVAAVAGTRGVRILAWDDQAESLQPLRSNVCFCGPRRRVPLLHETAASLRWADGWRGGLLGRTTFDRGFHAESILTALDAEKANAAVVVDPSSAFIEPSAMEELIAHLDALPEQAYAFTPGAVGTGAMILRRDLVAEMARTNSGPGSLTMYQPDRPVHDPIAKSFSVKVAPRIARSSSRLTVDSDRQATRISLVQAGAPEAMIEQLDRSVGIDRMPRDVTLELTTRRATKPVWSMLKDREVARPDLTLETARKIFAQLAEVDDIRLTLGGVGDPLLHPRALDIIKAAQVAGIRAIHVETDLLPESESIVTELAATEIDVVSVALPAAHASTYARLMGVDRMRDVLENVKRFLLARAQRATGLPILAPTFMKCEDNLGEMEMWYDQWIRAVGGAVITAPSDFSARIDYVGLSEMTAGRRRPCRRLSSRMTILSDGSIASCEEDVLGEQIVGRCCSIGRAWSEGLSMLRSLHDEQRWAESPLCFDCLMWDRT